MTRRFLPLAAALFALSLTLSSCVRWNIGERIRQGSETRTGADIAHCVDGKLYDGRYVVAPEVTYRPKSRWVYAGLKPRPAEAADIKRTGRSIIAEIQPAQGQEPARFVRSVRALPAGAKATAFAPLPPATEDSLGTTACNHNRAGKHLRLAAAPFYVIDPLLNVVSTPFYWLYVGGKTLVTGQEPQWELPAAD